MFFLSINLGWKKYLYARPHMILTIVLKSSRNRRLVDYFSSSLSTPKSRRARFAKEKKAHNLPLKPSTRTTFHDLADCTRDFNKWNKLNLVWGYIILKKQKQKKKMSHNPLSKIAREEKYSRHLNSQIWREERYCRCNFILLFPLSCFSSFHLDFCLKLLLNPLVQPLSLFINTPLFQH